MPTTVKEMLATANAKVQRISPQDAAAMVDSDDALLVDVRDAPELQQSGKAKGALNVSRGLIEFRADPESPMHHPEFRKDRPVILYCASGGRSALAGLALQEMGYAKVYNLGGFADWAEAGMPVERS